jgi:hypothetical protein
LAGQRFSRVKVNWSIELRNSFPEVPYGLLVQILYVLARADV